MLIISLVFHEVLEFVRPKLETKLQINILQVFFAEIEFEKIYQFI
jgi:hypothetical protein